MLGLVDHHTHTARCGHATGWEEDYIRRACELGLAGIAITDHIPFYWLPREQHDPTLAMAPEELPRYVESVLSLKEKYRGQIQVFLGIEADYIEGAEEELARILESYPFDLVLGSVHWLDGFWVDAPSSLRLYQEGQERVESIWESYWQKLEKAIATGFFHVMAHLDLPKKFGFFPSQPFYHWEDRVLQALLAKGVAVELSSAGRRKPVGEDYPSREWLRKLTAAGVPLVLSSDAHSPQEVGFAFSELQTTLQQLGVQPADLFAAKRTSRF